MGAVLVMMTGRFWQEGVCGRGEGSAVRLTTNGWLVKMLYTQIRRRVRARDWQNTSRKRAGLIHPDCEHIKSCQDCRSHQPIMPREASGNLATAHRS